MHRRTWQGILALASSLSLIAAVPGCGGSSKGGTGGDNGGSGGDDDDAGTSDASTTNAKGDGSTTTNKKDGGTKVELPDGNVITVPPYDSGVPPVQCTKDSDCALGVCVQNVCIATSTDGEQDGNETDTDCGGALNVDGTTNTSSDGAPVCAVGQKCLLGYDCGSFVCFTGAVTTPSADGSPIDCPSGSMCTCQAPTDTDGVKNDSETDRDCGGQLGAGGVANPASDQAGGAASLCTSGPESSGQHCKFGTDCDQGVCNANAGTGGLPDDCPAGSTCTCQLPSPTDHVKNGGESDVDCGNMSTDGATACADINPVTGVASTCATSSDCESKHCDGTPLKCVPATPNDGIQNGGESDVDCGGAVDANGVAIASSDNAGKCKDVNAKSGVASTCTINQDCKSGYCSSVQKICVDGYSCAVPVQGSASPILDITTEATKTADAKGMPNVNGIGEIAGITTCGRGEATDDHSTAAGLVSHESCCKSLDVSVTELGATAPTAIRIDKYEVTAGRMRQFIEATSNAEGGTYNLRAWVKAQFTANANGTYTPKTAAGTLLAQQIPTGQAGDIDIIDLYPDALSGDPLNMEQQLGGTAMDNAVPSYEQGCYMGAGSGGAATYWQNSAQEDDVGSVQPRRFTQDYYDIKSMNCTPYWMAAAFCAWDGGHLVTHAEYDALWGTKKYPWGDDSRLWNDIKPKPATYEFNQDYTINNLNEQEYFYFYPSPGNPASLPAKAGVTDGIIDTLDDGDDYSPYIAAPGRFARDITTLTATAGSIFAGDSWMDVGANMFEFHQLPVAQWNQQSSQFCDTSGNLPAPSSTTYPNNPNNCPLAGAGNTSCTVQGGDGNVQECGILRATLPYELWQGGSWEVHIIPGGPDNDYGEPLQTQYGKTSFRCARAAE